VVLKVSFPPQLLLQVSFLPALFSRRHHARFEGLKTGRFEVLQRRVGSGQYRYKTWHHFSRNAIAVIDADDGGSGSSPMSSPNTTMKLIHRKPPAISTTRPVSPLVLVLVLDDR